MSDRKRWASKEEAKQFIHAYEKRVDIIDPQTHEVRKSGPKGLSYWAAKDYLKR